MARKRQQLAELELDIYARVSRLSDERQRSVEGQVLECTDRVIEAGARVGKVLDGDRGKSAWDDRVKRPDWDELMRRLEAGLSGGVCVFDLSRFSRRPREGERLIAAAERGLVVLDSESEYDLTTPNGKKAFRDQLNSAAHYSDQTSTKTRRGKRLRAIKGETNNSQRPFGWEDDNATLRAAEADALADAAERVLAGESQDAIVIEWNQAGILTATGKEWSRSTLRQVLLRPRNAGIAVYRGEILREPSIDPDVLGKPKRLVGVEPVFDVAVWEDLDALYASRRRGRPNSDAYACSGTVRCGLCYHTLTGRPRKNMKPYADGEVKRQYWCQPRAQDGGCGRISVDQRELDKHVGELVATIMADPRHAAAVEAASKVRTDRRQQLNDDLERAEQLAAELSGRLGREEISIDRYDAAIAPLDKKIARIRADLAKLGDEPDVDLPAEPAASASALATWRRRWEDAEVVEKRVLLRRALRGRWLVVNPLPLTAPRKFDPKRIEIVDPKKIKK